MDIVGQKSFDEINKSNFENLTVSLTRKAWSMLRTFGREEYARFDPEELDLDVELGEVYDSVSTEEISYGDQQQYRACLDQFPSFNGVTITEIGFVALHLMELDDFDEEIFEQQVVFRLENHRYGPAVFTGTYISSEAVEDFDDLLELESFLSCLEEVMWQNQLQDGFSSLNALPLSDTMYKLERLLSQDNDIN
jgi:hypothetical protein